MALDTGGTFTDGIAEMPDGSIRKIKVLSNGSLRAKIIEKISPKQLRVDENWGAQEPIFKGYTFRLLGDNSFTSSVENYDPGSQVLSLEQAFPADIPAHHASFSLDAAEEAPILAARIITQTPLDKPLPPLEMKLGTTRGTNALLERDGAPTLVLLSPGFGDILKIRDQRRPDLFALKIEVAEPLSDGVLEVEGRIDHQGQIIQELQLPAPQTLEAFKNSGITSVAIALINAYQNPIHEEKLAEYIRSFGFAYISISTRLSPHIQYLPRSETSVVNAYLDPILSQYLDQIEQVLRPNNGQAHHTSLKVMSSAGSLHPPQHFQAKDSLLSGPAGGVLGAHQIARQTGIQKHISFDMGGTSTDVARADGYPDYTPMLEIGSARLMSTSFHIETVASGGGSICYFDGFKLGVGPQSAGAFPGPASYGAGGPLSITDVHLLLGRMVADAFNIPIVPTEAQKALESIMAKMEDVNTEKTSSEAILSGFLEIAHELIAGAIQKISQRKGYDPQEYSLIAYGGAGGLHACGIAEILKIKHIVIPENAGLLSAYGIRVARPEKFAEATILETFSAVQTELEARFDALGQKAKAELVQEGNAVKGLVILEKIVALRLQGQETSLEIPMDKPEQIPQDFEKNYRQVYGHWIENRELEIAFIRIKVGLPPEEIPQGDIFPSVPAQKPEASRKIKSFLQGKWQQIPVYRRENLEPGTQIKGGALLLDAYSTTVVEPDWTVRIDAMGHIHLNYQEPTFESSDNSVSHQAFSHNQAVQLELFSRRFQSLAEHMGATLERTAFSVNVKERLDFSCALLDAKGYLIANAPHIPVHLGSLGLCVRKVSAQIDFQPGDVIVVNHPKYGGSHLPDVTLIKPLFDEEQQLMAFVANRAHHAEIGGIRPGSMPPQAQNLEEEGVVIAPSYLIKQGRAHWEDIQAIFEQAPYPSRSIHENMADLQAALASVEDGGHKYARLLQQFGKEAVLHYTEEIQKHANQKIQKALADWFQASEQGLLEAEEFLDDRTRLHVKIIPQDQGCCFDFSGSAAQHPGNLNANPSIVYSVVVYVLRLLLQEDIPLNDGLLRSIQIIIPEATILNPVFPEEDHLSPAVVGGNVETSQKLCNLLLKALGLQAGSQGTMNNVIFGNDTFGFYETIGGGGGAGPDFPGASGVHHHMTNTRITDPEILERKYPVRLRRFSLRPGSGGKGKYPGGDGLVRELEFLEVIELSILTQGRVEAPFGLAGGDAGARGQQEIIRAQGNLEPLQGVDQATLLPGDRLLVKTPGGGAYGAS